VRGKRRRSREEREQSEGRKYVRFVLLGPGTMDTTVGYFVVPKRYPNHEDPILNDLDGRLSSGTK
jgi:hypothetical protein